VEKGVDRVTDLPPMEPGMILFHDGHFWHVDKLEPANGPVDGRLLVSQTSDEAKN
jgi:hypothetical protein